MTSSPRRPLPMAATGCACCAPSSAPEEAGTAAEAQSPSSDGAPQWRVPDMRSPLPERAGTGSPTGPAPAPGLQALPGATTTQPPHVRTSP